MNKRLSIIAVAAILVLCSCGRDFSVTAGDRQVVVGKEVSDFSMTGEFLADDGASATVAFHRSKDVPGSGYEVVFHNGDIDGTIKSGSLMHVRNLYRSLADDGKWCTFSISVRGKNVRVCIGGTEVVNYTEPDAPFRAEGYSDMTLGKGSFSFSAQSGTVHFRNLKICGEPSAPETPDSPAMDEQNDPTIRFQQRDFPVIDWHVHLKGGLTREMTDSMSKAFGICYGVAPNAGEGGVGRMLASDGEVYEYFDEMKDFPFMRGVQGEGRFWTGVFSHEALGIFDYLFTDAMTIFDHKGRISRIYRPEEVILDGIGKEAYMDHLVGQTVKILSYEPADIYANATFLPDCFQAEYESLWTDERVDAVLDVMKANGVAMEISARYRIPSERIIRRAKDKGLKFTFGTNNVDADFGRLEYCLEMVDKCGLSEDDMWYPSISVRDSRLPRDNWEEGTYQKLTALLSAADSLESPYAVFDFDDTSIINNLEYSLFTFQIINLRYRMKPCEFRSVVTRCVPDCTVPVYGDCSSDMLVKDLEEDYKFLYDNHIGNSVMTLDEIRQTEQYLDFRAKMYALCYGVEDRFPEAPAYLWLLQPLYGYSYSEISDLVKESCSYWMSFPEVSEVIWTSPDSCVCTSHKEGMRVPAEMKHLFSTLQKAGVTVYVCSASLETIVEAIACDPGFGFGLDSEHVFGLRFPVAENGLVDVRLDTTQYQPFLEGKTELIRACIAPSHGGHGPILVAGDSNGDYSMLTEYQDMKLGLIIWCGSKGKIRELALNGGPRYTVQHKSLNPPGFVREQSEL